MVLSWLEADSNNANDVGLFRAFLEKDFNYHCTAYQIVSLSATKPDFRALRAALMAMETQSTNDSLSIIYYNGNAYINAGHNPPAIIPKDCVLFPKADMATSLPGSFDVETTKFGVSYGFEEDVKIIAGDMTEWLSSRDGPGYVQDLKLVGYFKGRSSTVLPTMPIAAWAILESKSAYKLLDFISSDNLMLTREKRESCGVTEDAVEAGRNSA